MILYLIFLNIILLSSAFASEANIDRYYELEDEIDHLKKRRQISVDLLSRPWNRHNPFTSFKLFEDIENIEEEIIVKREELENLGDTPVEAMQMFTESHSYLKTTDINSIAGYIFSPQERRRIFFSSNYAFESWNRKKGNLYQKAYFYAHQNDYIRQCLRTVDDKKSYVVKAKYRLCRDSHGHFNGWILDLGRYRLEKTAEQIKLFIKLHFHFRGELSQEDEAFRLLRETRSCVQDFFARHGIVLKFGIYGRSTRKPIFDKEPLAWAFQLIRNPFVYDHSVNLHPYVPRADALNWPYYQTGTNVLGKNERCTLFTHELLHLIGLTDTYKDVGCLGNEVKPQDNIMTSSIKRHISMSEIYPEDLEQILDPLCYP